MAKLKISKTHTVTGARSDQHTGAQVTSGSTTYWPGQVGGVYTQAGPQIHAQVRVKGQTAAEGGILLMKGSHKHYVQDENDYKGQCTLVNKAKADLAEGEMSITVTLLDTTTFYAKKITNHFVWDFDNVKYRYWSQGATTNNPYLTDRDAGVTGFVQVLDAS